MVARIPTGIWDVKADDALDFGVQLPGLLLNRLLREVQGELGGG